MSPVQDIQEKVRQITTSDKENFINRQFRLTKQRKGGPYVTS